MRSVAPACKGAASPARRLGGRSSILIWTVLDVSSGGTVAVLRCCTSRGTDRCNRPCWRRPPTRAAHGGGMTDDIGGTETALAEVLDVLAALSALGCRFWLEGGWGVDALVGRQTRAHRDLDVDLDARCEEPALTVLAELGYTEETDWRPNRVELHAPGRGRVDLHPLHVDEDGRRPSTGVPRIPWGVLCRRLACWRPGSLRLRRRAARLFRTGYELRGWPPAMLPGARRAGVVTLTQRRPASYPTRRPIGSAGPSAPVGEGLPERRLGPGS